MNKLLILLILITSIISSCAPKKDTLGGTEIPHSQSPTVDDSQQLVFDANKATSINAIDSVNLGPVDSSKALTKTIYVSNSSGSSITLDFSALNAKLALAGNSRFSISSNNCSSTLKNGLSCSFVVSLKYVATEDYTNSIISQITSYPSNPEYGKITLSGSKVADVSSTYPLSSVFKLSTISDSFSMSPTTTTIKKQYYITNISTLTQTAPSITSPQDGVVSGSTCSGTLKPTLSCYFYVTYNYSTDPTKASYNTQIGFSSSDPKADTTGFVIALAISNQQPVITPVFSISQSGIISNMQDSTTKTRVYVLNTGTVAINPTISNFPSPFKLQSGATCTTTLKASSSCYYDLTLDTTKTTNMTGVSRPVSLDSVSTYSKNIVAGTGNAALTSIDTSCVSGYEPSSDKLSCVVSPCSLTNAVGNGLTSVANVATVKGMAPTCLVDTCQPNYTKSADEKSCQSSACTLSNAVGNGLTTITNVLTVKGTPPTCLVDTCQPNYSKSADEKTCQVLACNLTNAVGNGLTSVSNVATVKGNAPSCLVDTCQPTYTKSADEKTCQAPILRKITINKKLGGALSSLPTASATSVTTARIINGASASISLHSTPFPINSQSINFQASDAEITSAPNVNLQYPDDAGYISIGYKYVGSQVDGGTSQLYQTKSTGFAGYGLSIPITNGADHTIDMNYEADCSLASPILDTGVVSTNALTYKQNATKTACLINTCSPSYTVAADFKSCSQNATLTVIRGTQPSDLKCAVSITGLPAINDTTMVVDSGPQQTSNTLTNNSTASVVVGSCATGYSAKIDEVNSASDLTPTALSATECVNGTCSLIMSQSRFVKVTVSKIQYPFQAIGQDSSSNQIDQATTNIVLMTPATLSGAIGDSLTFNTSIPNANMYNATACNSYSSSFGTNSIYNPVFPNCANVLNSDILELKTWILPTGLTSATLTNSTLVGTVVATPDLITNKVIAKYGEIVNTMASDFELLTSDNIVSIYPQSNDQIQITNKFYDKNLNNQVSGVSLKIKNSSSTDVSSRFTLTCSNASVALTSSLTSASNVLIKNCLNSGGALIIDFLYDSLTLSGDPVADSITKDDFRTGSYTLEFTSLSSKKANNCSNPGDVNCSTIGTKITSIPVKINPDNDFSPTFSLKDNSTSTIIPDHKWDKIPYVTVGSADYEYGKSTKKYDLTIPAQANHSTYTTISSYQNMDYNFSVPFLADATNVKVSVNPANVPDGLKSKAFNFNLKIADSRNNESCQFVKSRRIGADNTSFANPSNRKSIQSISDFSSYNTTYIANAETESIVKDADSVGCISTGSGISALPNATPVFTEKYDFIGNDDWICDAGEVCYVNSFSESSVGAAKIAERTYHFKIEARNEDNEVNYSTQVVRVEKPQNTSTSLGATGVNFDITPYVDSRMNDTNEGSLYTSLFTNDVSKLTWIDYKAPVDSLFNIQVSNVVGIDCSSGCTYSLIRYKDLASSSNVNKSLYINNDLGGNAPTFGSSAQFSSVSFGGQELYNHNMEVLLVVKKDNATYKRLINMAATNKIRTIPNNYMIQSVYSNGNLTKLNLRYDLNRYDTNYNVINDTKSVSSIYVSNDSYAVAVRNNFSPSLYTTLNGSSNAYNGTAYLSGQDFTYTGTNLNFWKLIRVNITDGDYYHTYFNFKQCPAATPYYFYDYSSLSWGCYNQSTAQANGWIQ